MNTATFQGIKRVEDVGPEVKKLKKGNRVIIPFNVSCGEWFYCKHDLTCMCDNSNQHGEAGGFFVYSETFGGFPVGLLAQKFC